jgi:hypothetical protein
LLLGFGLLLGSIGEPSTVKVMLGVGFALSIVSSSALVFLRCPQCERRFIGSQSPGDEAPTPYILTRVCRHCGHLPD